MRESAAKEFQELLINYMLVGKCSKEESFAVSRRKSQDMRRKIINEDELGTEPTPNSPD